MADLLPSNEGQNYGEDEDTEMNEWLEQNKLTKARAQLQEFEVTLDELKKLQPHELEDFAKETLGLNAILVRRFVEAVQLLPGASSNSSQQKPSTQKHKIIRIVLSKEEDTAINNISTKCQNITKYLNKSLTDMETMKNSLKQNEIIINEFKKELSNRISIRMNSLMQKSNQEINKKVNNLQQHIQNIRQYNNELNNAKNEINDKLLMDDTIDQQKRKIKILEIEQHLLQKHQRKNIVDLFNHNNIHVTVALNKQKIFAFIDNIGEIQSFIYPDIPKFAIQNVTDSSVTVSFSNISHPSIQCSLEMVSNYILNNDEDNDEKKLDWKEITTLKDKQTIFVLNKLKDNTMFGLRARSKNEFGFGKYSKIQSFKTKKNQFTMDTKILTLKEQQQFVKLVNTGNKNVGQNFRLLFRASRDGFTSKSFHETCDNKGQTVGIIETKDKRNVFGGFTSIPWASESDAYKKDEFAFVFLMRSSQAYKTQSFDIKKSKVHCAVYHSSANLCTWGDIWIYDNCNTKCNCNFNSSKYYDYGDLNGNILNGGTSNFGVNEVEVFQCE